MRADYKCQECNTIVEFIKQHGVEFPEYIGRECKNTNEGKMCNFYRYFNSMPVVSVSEGGDGVMYNQAPLTPKTVHSDKFTQDLL